VVDKPNAFLRVGKSGRGCNPAPTGEENKTGGSRIPPLSRETRDWRLETGGTARQDGGLWALAFGYDSNKHL